MNRPGMLRNKPAYGIGCALGGELEDISAFGDQLRRLRGESDSPYAKE